MKSSESLSKYINAIIEVARLAPSVHNSQPWMVSCTDNVIEINVDERNRLHQGDPTGRQTYISLGIFCEAVIQAAAMFGFAPEKTNNSVSGIKVQFSTSAYRYAIPKFSALISKRSSDRSIYRKVDLQKNNISAFEHAAVDHNIEIRVITDSAVIDKIAYLTSKGINLALKNPSFRSELKDYLIVPWSKKKRGISVKSLYINPALEVLEPLLMQLGIGIEKEVQLEKRRWQSASGVIVLLTDGDLMDYWFQAGRSYLRVSLLIEAAGFSQATSAAIVEAADFHDDFEALIHTKMRVQAVIRIGKGAAKKNYSPRVAGSDLITSR